MNHPKQKILSQENDSEISKNITRDIRFKCGNDFIMYKKYSG